MKKEIKCNIINLPDTEEEIRTLQERATKALALAIYRSFSSEKLDRLIEELRLAIACEKNDGNIQKRPETKVAGCK